MLFVECTHIEHGPGLPNTDFVLYVTAKTDDGCAHNIETVASAGFCTVGWIPFLECCFYFAALCCSMIRTIGMELLIVHLQELQISVLTISRQMINVMVSCWTQQSMKFSMVNYI